MSTGRERGTLYKSPLDKGCVLDPHVGVWRSTVISPKSFQSSSNSQKAMEKVFNVLICYKQENFGVCVWYMKLIWEGFLYVQNLVSCVLCDLKIIKIRNG